METTLIVHGVEIPRLGFGTYSMERETLLRVLPAALNSGFNHVDTAQIYRNEDVVGECIELSGRSRH
jgi:2,5-diketo-D-gluconate reductase B